MGLKLFFKSRHKCQTRIRHQPSRMEFATLRTRKEFSVKFARQRHLSERCAHRSPGTRIVLRQRRNDRSDLKAAPEIIKTDVNQNKNWLRTNFPPLGHATTTASNHTNSVYIITYYAMYTVSPAISIRALPQHLIVTPGKIRTFRYFIMDFFSLCVSSEPRAPFTYIPLYPHPASAPFPGRWYIYIVFLYTRFFGTPPYTLYMYIFIRYLQ